MNKIYPEILGKQKLYQVNINLVDGIRSRWNKKFLFQITFKN